MGYLIILVQMQFSISSHCYPILFLSVHIKALSQHTVYQNHMIAELIPEIQKSYQALLVPDGYWHQRTNQVNNQDPQIKNCSAKYTSTMCRISSLASSLNVLVKAHYILVQKFNGPDLWNWGAECCPWHATCKALPIILRLVYIKLRFWCITGSRIFSPCMF